MSLPDANVLRDVFAAMREHGVARLRVGEVSVEMGTASPSSPHAAGRPVSALTSTTPAPPPPSPEAQAAVARAVQAADDSPMTPEEREYYEFIHGAAPPPAAE